MKRKFLIVNPKNYLNYQETLDLASYTDVLAEETGANLLFTAPFPYLVSLKKKYKNIKVIAQHADLVEGGIGMGKVSVEALNDIGVDGIVLNHAENPLSYDALIKIVSKMNDLNLISIVCSSTVKEAQAIALLNPTVILCEPTELIGKGQVSDLSYVEETNRIIRETNPNIQVEQAAGVSSGDDVYRIIKAGSDGTGATSAIVKADDPKAVLKDMVEGLLRAEGALNDC